MNETNPLSTYEAIHEEIKRELSEIDSLVFAYYPHFENDHSAENAHPFSALLDQLLTLKETLETVKKSVYSKIECQIAITENTPL